MNKQIQLSQRAPKGSPQGRPKAAKGRVSWPGFLLISQCRQDVGNKSIMNTKMNIESHALFTMNANWGSTYNYEFLRKWIPIFRVYEAQLHANPIQCKTCQRQDVSTAKTCNTALTPYASPSACSTAASMQQRYQYDSHMYRLIVISSIEELMYELSGA